jgi:hypothetical protein
MELPLPDLRPGAEYGEHSSYVSVDGFQLGIKWPDQAWWHAAALRIGHDCK